MSESMHAAYGSSISGAFNAVFPREDHAADKWASVLS